VRRILKERVGEKNGLWTSDGHDELREFEVRPLVQDKWWERKFVHQEPCYHWKSTENMTLNHVS